MMHAHSSRMNLETFNATTPRLRKRWRDGRLALLSTSKSRRRTKKPGRAMKLTLPGLNYILAQALDYGPLWGWTPAIQVPHVPEPLTYMPLPHVAGTLFGFVPGSSGAAAE
jgi:hypothetical protein